LRLTKNIDEPISAILTLNTAAHTLGAAVAGAVADDLFGADGMVAFTVGLTFLVLILSEIIPKTIGTAFWKSLAPLTAYLLEVMTIMMKPIFYPIKVLTGWIARNQPSEEISKGEVLNFIRMGHAQGVLGSEELRIMENLLQLDSIKVKEIMTPRTVVFWIPSDQGTDSLAGKQASLQFSRIPVYNVPEDTVEGVVLRRDIVDYLSRHGENVSVKTLARKPEFILEKMSVFKLLNLLIASKTHLAVVLSEHGDFVGIVTMEDAIETLLGQEIVDEFDPVVDMRTLARKQGFQRWKNLKR